jgi:hypothetical protein
MLDIGWLDIGCWMLDIVYCILDVGCWILDIGWLDIGCWMLDIVYWILDVGYWMVGWNALLPSLNSTKYIFVII